MHTEQIQWDYLMHMQSIPFSLSTHLMHAEQIQSDHLIHMQQMYIYNPQSCPTDLEKTPMDDLNNLLLLLHRHLVIARQAEPTTENISPNILKSA